MSRIRRRLSASLLPAGLFAPPAFALHFAEGKGGDGGKGGTPTPTPSPGPTATKTDDDDKPVTLTKAQLAEQLRAAGDEASRAVREQLEADRKKEKDDADKKKLEDEGKFKELATAAEGERDRLKLEMKGRDVDIALRDYLAEKHPAYLPAAKWVRPAVAFDAGSTAETIARRVQEAADAYVKDNPRATGNGPPAPPPRSGVAGGSNVPQKDKPTAGGDPIRARRLARFPGPRPRD